MKSIFAEKKQDDYGFMDYECNLELSTAPNDPQLGVASPFVSNHDQTKHQHNQEAFVIKIAKVEQSPDQVHSTCLHEYFYNT